MKKSVKLISFLALLFLVIVPIRAASHSDKDSDTLILSKENTLVLNSVIDGDSVPGIIIEARKMDVRMSALKERVTGKKPIYLFLNTPGGDIQLGLEMIEALEGIGRPVHTITLFAASMGFQTAQNLGTRFILSNGVLMSHRAQGEFVGSFGGQKPSQLDNRYALWLSRVDELDMVTVKRTNGKKTLESYRKQYADEMWLTGAQSVEEGYADKVVKVKCDVSMAGTTRHSADTIVGPVTYEIDNCPLNTSPINIQISIPTSKGTMASDEFIKQGGQFGPQCLVELSTNKNKLCALDTSLSPQKIEQLKKEFLIRYDARMRKVVDIF